MLAFQQLKTGFNQQSFICQAEPPHEAGCIFSLYSECSKSGHIGWIANCSVKETAARTEGSLPVFHICLCFTKF